MYSTPMPRLHINPAYCKGCHICIAFCPKQALQPAETMNEKGYVLPVAADMERCSLCLLCEKMCPDFAIAIERDVQ